MICDDFQPGDLALCVKAGPVPLAGLLVGTGRDLRPGAIYTVVRTGVTAAGAAGLLLEGIPVDPRDLSRGFKRATRFRKIRPHQADTEDAETIALLTGTPAKVTA